MAEFKTLIELDDPWRASILQDLLQQAGIQATTAGLNHNALFGAAGAFVRISIQVPSEALEQARELLATLEDESGQFLEEDEGQLFEEPAEPEVFEPLPTDEERGPYRSNAKPSHAPLVSPRLRRVAAFCALVITFGCGHFYARHFVTGWVLAFTQVGLFAAGLDEPRLLWAIPGLVAYDLIGSQYAVRRHNEGRSIPQARLVATLALVFVAAIGLAWWLEPLLAPAPAYEPFVDESLPFYPNYYDYNYDEEPEPPSPYDLVLDLPFELEPDDPNVETTPASDPPASREFE